MISLESRPAARYRRRALPSVGLAIVALSCTVNTAGAQGTERRYLSGTGSDSTVAWEFRVSGGRRAGEWRTIPVPSNWEMQGFGTFRYHDDWSRDPAPDSVGEYRYRFRLAPGWRGKRVDLVFGASMTDTEVRVNGHSAGPVHRGGFYQFRYDVTPLLRHDADNLLEVRVRRFSRDSSVNRAERHADYWLFSGIYRPVWLEARPTQHIARVAVDARHMGALSADVALGGIAAPARLTARVERLDGTAMGAPFSAAVPPGTARIALRTRIRGIEPWSAEQPTRYRLRLRLHIAGATVHEVTETIGFRTVEVRPHDGFYVNGVPVRLKGSNRHSFWPATGRTTSRALSVRDVQLVKDMNMNAVRMSHYPPDEHFLEAADSLGLYVIDELAGWQQAYSTAAGRPLVREMIERDVNHPSIVLWANGNEGGWNRELDGDFAQHDPQRRTVIHPWENFGGINTSHYETYDCCAGFVFGGDDLILPTEFLHALYDGGGGAGLEDWWNRMLRHPLAIGGFIWAFADEGIVREDQGGRIDVAGNLAPDGIVGPHREREGSFFTIKRVWSPVFLPLGELDRLPPTFDGALRVENRYDFTDLARVHFAWRLLDFPRPGAGDGTVVGAQGIARSPRVPPRGVGTLRLALPSGWRRHDALALTATDRDGREIYTWTWMLHDAGTLAGRIVSSVAPAAASPVIGSSAGGVITMRAGEAVVRIDSASGRLQGVTSGGTDLSLRNGPRLVEGVSALVALEHHRDGGDYVVEARYDGELRRVRWRLSPTGWLRLDYTYTTPSGAAREFLGVTFDHPEAAVTGLRWLGRGPYRVWKNRLKGVEFGLWHKAYNDAVTGVRWEYPEFKGFHADVYWATLETRESPITMVFGANDLFLRVFTPAEAHGEGAEPGKTHVRFPPGDLSILHGIPAIGTKFSTAAEQGPAGGPNLSRRHGGHYEATVWLYFGQPPAAGPAGS